MKRPVVVAAMIALCATAAFSQKLPTFSRYKTHVERIGNVKVDLKSHKTARTFRTNLRNAAKEGINFAGHYILTGWGCGTNCSQWAIIDAGTAVP